jgi:hypothetical protein
MSDLRLSRRWLWRILSSGIGKPSSYLTGDTLKLCKVWGYHGSDYEECRLLGYENPVRTSQETHYFSTRESSYLMLCKIWGFHGGDYEECRLLECYPFLALVKTDISEERIASIIRETRIGELGTKLAVTRNRSMLRRNSMMELIRSFATSVHTRATRRNIPVGGILNCHRREHLKSYILVAFWLCNGDVMCSQWGRNRVSISQ